MDDTKTLPLFGDIVPPNPAKSARLVVENLLYNAKLSTELMPYLTGEGVCGEKHFELKEVVDRVKKYDGANGNKLATFRLDDWQLGIIVKNVLRTRYEL